MPVWEKNATEHFAALKFLTGITWACVAVFEPEVKIVMQLEGK